MGNPFGKPKPVQPKAQPKPKDESKHAESKHDESKHNMELPELDQKYIDMGWKAHKEGDVIFFYVNIDGETSYDYPPPNKPEVTGATFGSTVSVGIPESSKVTGVTFGSTIPAVSVGKDLTPELIAAGGQTEAEMRKAAAEARLAARRGKPSLTIVKPEDDYNRIIYFLKNVESILLNEDKKSENDKIKLRVIQRRIHDLTKSNIEKLTGDDQKRAIIRILEHVDNEEEKRVLSYDDGTVTTSKIDKFLQELKDSLNKSKPDESAIHKSVADQIAEYEKTLTELKKRKAIISLNIAEYNQLKITHAKELAIDDKTKTDLHKDYVSFDNSSGKEDGIVIFRFTSDIVKMKDKDGNSIKKEEPFKRIIRTTKKPDESKLVELDAEIGKIQSELDKLKSQGGQVPPPIIVPFIAPSMVRPMPATSLFASAPSMTGPSMVRPMPATSLSADIASLFTPSMTGPSITTQPQKLKTVYTLFPHIVSASKKITASNKVELDALKEDDNIFKEFSKIFRLAQKYKKDQQELEKLYNELNFDILLTTVAEKFSSEELNTLISKPKTVISPQAALPPAALKPLQPPVVSSWISAAPPHTSSKKPAALPQAALPLAALPQAALPQAALPASVVSSPSASPAASAALKPLQPPVVSSWISAAPPHTSSKKPAALPQAALPQAALPQEIDLSLIGNDIMTPPSSPRLPFVSKPLL